MFWLILACTITTRRVTGFTFEFGSHASQSSSTFALASLTQLQSNEEVKKVGYGISTIGEGNNSIFDPEQQGRLQGTGSLASRIRLGVNYTNQIKAGGDETDDVNKLFMISKLQSETDDMKLMDDLREVLQMAELELDRISLPEADQLFGDCEYEQLLQDILAETQREITLLSTQTQMQMQSPVQTQEKAQLSEQTKRDLQEREERVRSEFLNVIQLAERELEKLQISRADGDYGSEKQEYEAMLRAALSDAQREIELLNASADTNLDPNPNPNLHVQTQIDATSMCTTTSNEKNNFEVKTKMMEEASSSALDTNRQDKNEHTRSELLEVIQIIEMQLENISETAGDERHEEMLRVALADAQREMVLSYDESTDSDTIENKNIQTQIDTRIDSTHTREERSDKKQVHGEMNIMEQTKNSKVQKDEVLSELLEVIQIAELELDNISKADRDGSNDEYEAMLRVALTDAKNQYAFLVGNGEEVPMPQVPVDVETVQQEPRPEMKTTLMNENKGTEEIEVEQQEFIKVRSELNEVIQMVELELEKKSTRNNREGRGDEEYEAMLHVALVDAKTEVAMLDQALAGTTVTQVDDNITPSEDSEIHIQSSASAPISESQIISNDEILVQDTQMEVEEKGSKEQVARFHAENAMRQMEQQIDAIQAQEERERIEAEKEAAELWSIIQAEQKAKDAKLQEVTTTMMAESRESQYHKRTLDPPSPAFRPATLTASSSRQKKEGQQISRVVQHEMKHNGWGKETSTITSTTTSTTTSTMTKSSTSYGTSLSTINQ